MRFTFDQKVSRAEQLTRTIARKKVGRKHNGTIGPGKANLAAARRDAWERHLREKKWKIYHKEVARYWSGQRDNFPEKPPYS